MLTDVLSIEECRSILAAAEAVGFHPDQPVGEEGASVLAHVCVSRMKVFFWTKASCVFFSSRFSSPLYRILAQFPFNATCHILRTSTG